MRHQAKRLSESRGFAGGPAAAFLINNNSCVCSGRHNETTICCAGGARRCAAQHGPAAAPAGNADTIRIPLFSATGSMGKGNDLITEDVRAWCTPATKVVHGRPYEQILEAAEEMSADLIVLGVHGRNALDLMLFGSTTNQVIRRATCPVLTRAY